MNKELLLVLALLVLCITLFVRNRC